MFPAKCDHCGTYNFGTREQRASWAIGHKHDQRHNVTVERSHR